MHRSIVRFRGRTGSTTDLTRRLAEHNRGHTHTTRRLGGTLALVASREFPTLTQARRCERLLKRKKNPQLAIAALSTQTPLTATPAPW